MTAHARFSPSSADRWSKCQISLLPYDGPSARNSDDTAYSKSGTCQHKAAVECIQRQIKPIELVMEDAEFANLPFSVEMCEPVGVYVDAVRNLTERMHYDFYLEQHIEAHNIHPDCEGTTDFMGWHEGERHLLIADYKSGWEIIEADTLQNAIYGVGAYRMLTERGIKIDKITCAIVQPADTNKPVKLKHYTPKELMKLADDLRKTTKQMNAVAGDHCKYCPHSGNCPTLDAYAEDALFESGSKPADRAAGELNTKRVIEILDRRETVSIWFSAVANYATQLIKLGEKLGPYYVGDSLGDRFWADYDDAVKTLHAKYGDDIYEPRVLRSPAQIEAIWPKSKPTVSLLTDRKRTGEKLKRSIDDE